MGRPQILDDNLVISTRITKQMYSLLNDIAALESMNSGKKVSIQELIRGALEYVYSDNERLRESFRRTRTHINKKIK